MPTPAAGTVGSLDYTPEERKVLARKSRNFECHICGPVADKLAENNGHKLGGNTLSAEESTLLKQISLKGEEENNRLQEKGEEVEAVQEIQHAEPPINETQQMSCDTLRQRLVECPADTNLAEQHDSLLQASIQRSNR